MDFTIPTVPDGVHPWTPAEQDFSTKIRPLIDKYLGLVVECVTLGNDLLARAQGTSDPQLFRVHANLLIRVLQDVRACALITEAGYPMQGWTVASAAFEAAHTLGYIGASVERAQAWLSHESDSEAFVKVFRAVSGTITYLGIAANQQEHRETVNDTYSLYQILCTGKHANPVRERGRYLYTVEGQSNLLLSPVFSPRRTSEARLGLLLALRSAHVALWVFDVTHLAPPGLVDSRIESTARTIDSLVDSWRFDLERLVSDDSV